MGMAISFIASANAANAVFVAKSEKAANGGMLLAGLMAAVFALMPAFIGISARVVMPSIVPNSALYLMSSGQGEVFGGIIAMSIIAAILSTAPGLLIVVAATLTKDLYLTVIRPKASEKQQLKFTMFVIFAAGVIGTQIGIGKEAILDNMLGAFQIRSIAGIVLLTALAWPRVDERSAILEHAGRRRGFGVLVLFRQLEYCPALGRSRRVPGDTAGNDFVQQKSALGRISKISASQKPLSYLDCRSCPVISNTSIQVNYLTPISSH